MNLTRINKHRQKNRSNAEKHRLRAKYRQMIQVTEVDGEAVTPKKVWWKLWLPWW